MGYLPSSGQISLNTVRQELVAEGYPLVTSNFSLSSAIQSSYGDISFDVGDATAPHAMSEFYGALVFL
jgi:hypothetical protein